MAHSGKIEITGVGKVVNVSGHLEVLLKGLPITDVQDLIGKPITDGNNKVVGAITSIDKDTWYGYINGLLEFTNKQSSFSIN